jgi:hypothetical protein
MTPDKRAENIVLSSDAGALCSNNCINDRGSLCDHHRPIADAIRAAEIEVLERASSAILMDYFNACEDELGEIKNAKEAEKAPDKFTAWCWARSHTSTRIDRLIENEIARCKKEL